jgi:pimeloyl-ACP methyl ester carboxylesterase
VTGVTTMVQAGPHRIEATVFGSGTPTVVIEPAYGGQAAAWQTIAERLAAQTSVIAYDRAPYGASGPARDRRTAGDIAADLDAVLRQLGVTGPIVLVGHSIGGVYSRAFAARHPDRVAGMVLVDSSHEGQWAVLPARYSVKTRLLVALSVPQILVSRRGWRSGADRRSMLREYRSMKRLTAADLHLGAGDLGGLPLAVLTRGPDGPADSDRLWQAWCGLQRDLAALSGNSRHVISDSPMHYLNEGDPDLIVASITDVVRCARDGTQLGEVLARSSDGQ